MGQVEQNKDYFKTSWRGVLDIIYQRKIWLEWPFLACLAFTALVVVMVAVCGDGDSFLYLQQLCELSVSIFPNLLGFTLGGFAIVVGFSNTELLKKASIPEEYSVYQQLNAIFAYHLIFQVFTLLIAYVTLWLMQIDLSKVFEVYSDGWGKALNIAFIGLIFFGGLYSIILAIYSILNLFSLSQINSAFYSK